MATTLKKARILVLVLVGVLLAGCFGFGQWKVSGIVTDPANNPLAGVTLLVKAGKTVTLTTGDDGKWSTTVSGKEVEITAAKDGYEFEPVVVKKADNKPVTIVGTPKLTVSPAAEYYEEPISVTLAIGGDYKIFYTLDGSDPTAESEEYTAPIAIDEPGKVTVKAIAINNTDPTVTQTISAEYEYHNSGIINDGGFEFGLNYWHGRSCQLQVTDAESYNGTHSVLVTDRTETGSGPRYDLPTTIQHGQKYKVTVWVKYVAEAAPETRRFQICFQEGDDWRPIEIITGAEITKGEWGKIEGVYTIPTEIIRDGDPIPIPLANPRIFVETSWVANPDPNSDLMDYYVDAVSMILVEEEEQ